MEEYDRDRERLKGVVVDLEKELEKANSGDKNKIKEVKHLKD